MPFVRLKHAANGLEKNDQTKALPIVLIRDPFHWMQSMVSVLFLECIYFGLHVCYKEFFFRKDNQYHSLEIHTGTNIAIVCSDSQCGQPYAAKWEHTRQHCPNLVPSPADRKKFGADAFANDTVPIKVIFDKDQKFYWPSIVHLYNDYYLQYLKDADYPRLMVRFEDMLLMPHAVLEQIAQCVGVATAEHLKFQTGSSKGHGSHTNFVNAIVKTGNIERRTMGMTREDILFAAEHLDKELLETFQYTVPIV